MDTATGQVIGMLKTVLQATIDQLKRNWEAFRTNYGEAQTVLDYANRLLEALTPYANNTNLPGDLAEKLQTTAKEATATAEEVQEEISMAITLGGKMRTFLMADSLREKLRSLQSKLEKIVADLEQSIHFQNLLENELVGRVLDTMQNESAKNFWSNHAGNKEWQMPFLRFVEFYDFEARKASQSTPAQNDVPVIPPVQEQPANQLAELVDDTLEGNLPRRASSCFGSCFPSNRKDRNRAEAQRNGRNRGKPQRNGRNGLNLAEPQRSGRQGGEQTGAKGGIARPDEPRDNRLGVAPAEGVPPPADASVPVGVVPIGVAPVPVGVVPVGVVPVPVGAEPPPADAAVPIGGVPPPVPAVPPAEPPAAADSPREPADFPYTELTREDRKALLYALCGDEGKHPPELVDKKEDVTVFMLNRFVLKHGFPFNPAGLPEVPKFPAVLLSTAERLTVARICVDLMEDYFKPETDTQIKHVIDSLNDTAKRIGKVLAEQQSGGSLAVAEGSGEARTVAGISNPGASLGEVNPTGGLVKQKTSPEESKAAAGLSASAAKSDAKIPSAGSGSPAKPDNGNTDGASEEELEKTRAAGAAKLKAEAEEMRARYKLFPPPEGLADERKAEKYKERQLRCFAADWLTQKLEKREFDTLNQSRRQWSNFVLRYMTMWRLGNLTHDLFDDIDFLGTHRSYTFLEYCEPLDEANLRIKIHKYLDPVRRPSTEKKIAENSDNWEESRPKVYSFLRTLLKWKDESDDKKKDRAAKAPLPVLYGGIVPPPLTPPAAQQVVLDGAGAVVSDQRNSAEGGVLSGTAVAVPGNSGAGGAGAPENLGQGTAAPSSSGEGLRAPGNLPSDTGEIVPANPGPGAAAASVAAPGRTDQAVGSVK